MKIFNELLMVLENNELTNVAPLDEIKKHAVDSNELISDDDKFVVVSPKTHASACYYGKFTNSRFCIANPDDTSEFDRIKEIAGMIGEKPKFFYLFAKNMSLKNKKSILGIMVYPKMISQHFRQMSIDDIIAQGKQRFASMYNKEFSYSDEFLKKWIEEILAGGHFFESYNSKNKIIMPSELKAFIGSTLYSKLIG